MNAAVYEANQITQEDAVGEQSVDTMHNRRSTARQDVEGSHTE